MTTEGLQLASRFSLSPNALDYCGPNSAPSKLLTCVLSGECSGVPPELEQFAVLNPYLKTLAKITGREKFSYPVVEGYWLGNDELRKARSSDYDLLLQYCAQQQWPDLFVKSLQSRRPKKFIPFHLFHVLYVGVGRASGKLPFTLESINNCMVRWGPITSFDKKNNKLEAEVAGLEETPNKGYRLKISKENFDYDDNFVPGLQIGDTVAIHWKMVTKKLAPQEEVNLTCWTQEVLKNF